MKKILTALTLTTVFALPAFAEEGGRDIVITAQGVEFSEDSKTIRLREPEVSIKYLEGSTELKPLTVDQFVTYWNPEKQSSVFDKVHPNATLSTIDTDAPVEASFVIDNAEAPSPHRLDLSVSYLTNTQNHTGPILINGKPASLQQLRDLRNQQTSVTLIVDCIPILDGRC